MSFHTVAQSRGHCSQSSDWSMLKSRAVPTTRWTLGIWYYTASSSSWYLHPQGRRLLTMSIWIDNINEQLLTLTLNMLIGVLTLGNMRWRNSRIRIFVFANRTRLCTTDTLLANRTILLSRPMSFLWRICLDRCIRCQGRCSREPPTPADSSLRNPHCYYSLLQPMKSSTKRPTKTKNATFPLQQKMCDNKKNKNWKVKKRTEKRRIIKGAHGPHPWTLLIGRAWWKSTSEKVVRLERAEVRTKIARKLQRVERPFERNCVNRPFSVLRESKKKLDSNLQTFLFVNN